MNKLITFQLSIIFGLFLMLPSCEMMEQSAKTGETDTTKNIDW
ncbi:MAG: hypothetical protein ACI94Y_003655 [Maribacter sp.]|jgi:hypothetical protein